MKKILFTLLWMFLFFQVGVAIIIGLIAILGNTGQLPNNLFSPAGRATHVGLLLVHIVFVYGLPALALLLSLCGILPGTRRQKSVPVVAPPPPGVVPPPIPKMPPPPPFTGKGPRPVHHAFTHVNIPASFILGKNRGQYVSGLFRKEMPGIMRQSWRQVAREFGEDSNLAEQLELTTFRKDLFACGFWEFPTARFPGEAMLGLLLVGPLDKAGAIDWNTVPVRYFIVEREAGPQTRLLEWSVSGFKSLGKGPRHGDSITVFTDMVFDQVEGKKRPTARQVASRLLILRRIGVYAKVVPYGQQLNALPDLQPEAKSDLHSIFGELHSTKLREDLLWDEVSPKEREFLALPVQDITRQQVVNALWRLEAIQVLMWALGLLPGLPPYGVPADGEILKRIPDLKPDDFAASATLRDEREIEQARELAELWHWRSRTRQLQAAGQPCPRTEWMQAAGLNSYDDIIRKTVQVAVKDGAVASSIQDDFPVGEQAYRDLTDDEWANVRSITMERHFALNWLCGYAPGNQWDNTPTET